MWFNDVSKEPWCIKHATSLDGKKWRVTTDPVLEIDQEWESGRLFYPTVLKIDDVYLMWYGSYWTSRKKHDGHSALLLVLMVSNGIDIRITPYLNRIPNVPGNHTMSPGQSVMAFPDGSFRIWYARSKKPPFVNKYFAITTAHWNGPQTKTVSSIQKKTRRVYKLEKPNQAEIEKIAGHSLNETLHLKSEKRGELETDGTVIEKVGFHQRTRFENTCSALSSENL